MLSGGALLQVTATWAYKVSLDERCEGFSQPWSVSVQCRRPPAEHVPWSELYEFLLTASPLNLAGGVGSPSNAIAIK